jgi:hypothetical protein
MDSKMFRLPTSPNFYHSASTAAPVDIRQKSRTVPAPDSRFPGWPAPMSDARLVTDYMPHCSKNIPAGKQFPTKAWMQTNADEIIDFARKRSAETMGGMYTYDSSVVPNPLAVVKCTRSECSRKTTGAPGGIGVERLDSTPELFGTYSIQSMESPMSRTSYTMTAEGGRNSKRG